MSFSSISILNKRAIWSSLPPLLTHAKHRTKNMSRSQYKLHKNQVSQWTDFEKTVRDFTRGVLGNPTPGFAEMGEDELFWVGNELGMQSRFIEHIGQQVGKVYQKLDYRVLLGDYQSGIPMKWKADPAPRRNPSRSQKRKRVETPDSGSSFDLEEEDIGGDSMQLCGGDDA